MGRDKISINGKTLHELRSLGDLNTAEEGVLLALISRAKCCDRWWEGRFD